MESIEPFNYSELEDFNTAYLSGYLAEKYDVNEESSANRIKERITNSTESMFKDTTTGYSNVTTASKNINLQKDNFFYKDDLYCIDYFYKWSKCRSYYTCY